MTETQLESQLVALIKGDRLPPDAHENVRRVADMLEDRRAKLSEARTTLEAARAWLEDEYLTEEIVKQINATLAAIED